MIWAKIWLIQLCYEANDTSFYYRCDWVFQSSVWSSGTDILRGEEHVVSLPTKALWFVLHDALTHHPSLVYQFLSFGGEAALQLVWKRQIRPVWWVWWIRTRWVLVGAAQRSFRCESSETRRCLWVELGVGVCMFTYRVELFYVYSFVF